MSKISNRDSNLCFKIIVIGDSATGKTALINKYITGEFNQEVNVTVGVDFNSKTVEVMGKKIQLQIWDTSGQDIYRSVTRSFYRGAAAVFLVYAVNNRKSFQHVQEWLEQFQDEGSHEACVFLVGTKNDLKSDIQKQEAFDLLKRVNGTFFIETCSKNGDSVDKLFSRAAQNIIKLYTVSRPYRALLSHSKEQLSTYQSDIRSSIELKHMSHLSVREPTKKCC